MSNPLNDFKTRVALIRMGVPTRRDDHAVSDAEYERALEQAAKPMPLYCRCAFTDDDGTVVPGEFCPIHDATL